MEGTSAGRDAEARRQQVSHDDKLRRVGVNVARVAHELMSPVSLIGGSLRNLEEHFALLMQAVDALRREVAEPERQRFLADERLEYVLRNTAHLLSICNEGAERVTYVIEQLKGFARRREGGEPPTADLAAVLAQAERMAQLGRDPAPLLELQVGDLPAVRADPQSLGQAFVNVIRNAFDAVADRADGMVRITAGVVRREGDDDEVQVRVADNGPGISTLLRATIFEPFVSSKPAGGGLGLGLAIAREAVEAAGGALELGEGEGSGAEFVFRLPTARREPPGNFEDLDRGRRIEKVAPLRPSSLRE